MRTLTWFVVAALVAALPGTAAAAHRKAGLWEITTQSNFTQGGPQIPPDALAKMKAQGIKMPSFNEPHTYRQCLTPKQAAKDEHPDFGPQKNCQMQNSNWSGDHFHGNMVCTNQAGETHGTFDGSLGNSGESFAGTFKVAGTNPHLGGQFAMEGQSSGKWLGAQCGSGSR